MPNSHETEPEMPEVEIPTPEATPAPEGQETPQQKAEAAKRAAEKRNALDKMTSTAADAIAPAVMYLRKQEGVQKLDAEWRALKAEKSPEEIEKMFGTSNLESLLALIPGVPTLQMALEIFNTKENILKGLLLVGAIGGPEDEYLVQKIGDKSLVQKTLLFIVKVWGKVDPDVAALDKIITTGLSVEGFGLAVCKKVRQRTWPIGAPASPEVAPQQAVVEEVDHEREGTSAAVGIPPADHIHDVDDDVAAAA